MSLRPLRAGHEMGRLACALCVVAIFCDRALGAPSASPTPAPYVNATCPTKLSEYRPFAKVFFDEGCVAAMEPRPDGACPIDTLDTFVEYYFGALCIEAVVQTFAAFLANFLAVFCASPRLSGSCLA